MKKVSVFAVLIVILSVVLSGCKEPEIEPPNYESITFVDDLFSPTREFSINEILEFNVKFVAESKDPEMQEFLEDLFISVGTIVEGRVKDSTNKWTDEKITGTATNLRTPNGHQTLAEILPEIEIGIELNYTFVNDVISQIHVSFIGTGDPDDDILVLASELMMGGTYLRK